MCSTYVAKLAAYSTHFLATPFCCPQNPANKGQGPPNVPSAGPDPDYSDDQREEFGDRAWIAVEDRSLLDVAGTELLLVGAKDKPIETGGSPVPQLYCSMLGWLHERTAGCQPVCSRWTAASSNNHFVRQCDWRLERFVRLGRDKELSSKRWGWTSYK
jgi:hypothetical protein